MLRGLHKASSHFLGRIIMVGVLGFLILSFGIWGIGDIFRGFGRSSLAKVGSTEIGIEQFRQAYNDRLQQLSRRLGRPVTPDQARALGLQQQMLGQIIAEAALDERVRQLGLNVSESEVARQITSDPNFKGATGKFDRFRFEQMIRAAGYTEARYANEQRRVALRRQIADTIGGEVRVPKTAAELVNRYRNEQRTIEFIRLGPAQAGTIEGPTPDVLQSYFESHKTAFRAPEYRKVVLLPVTPQELANTIEVSEADARRYYDEHPDRYGKPERREIEQLVFPDEQDAQAAADRIAKGATFNDIAAERGVKPADMELGLVTKAQLFDTTVANAAFALPEGGVSAPIRGQFGTVLVRVVKLEPGSTQSFEAVEPEIKRQTALERARPELLDLHDKIEDDRAAGLHLDEIAAKRKLRARTIEVDRSGRDQNGNMVADLPASVDVIAAAFASDVDVESDPLTLPGGGFVWFNVAAITPSRDRSLDEVKAQVEARWRSDQIAERLGAQSTEFLDKLKAGASLAEVAGQLGVKLETLGGLKRATAAGSLPATVVEQAFATANGGFGAAQGSDPTDRILFRVTDVTLPGFDAASADVKRNDEALKRSLSEDVFGAYIAQLQSTLGVSVNSEALRRVSGAPEAD
jgi:peptidyl-prolyl cis-trans isomerase D